MECDAVAVRTDDLGDHAVLAFRQGFRHDVKLPQDLRATFMLGTQLILRDRSPTHFSRGCFSREPAATILPSRLAMTASCSVNPAFRTSPCMA